MIRCVLCGATVPVGHEYCPNPGCNALASRPAGPAFGVGAQIVGGPRARVVPGRDVRLPVRVWNVGHQVDVLSVHVAVAPQHWPRGWVAAETAPLYLLPGAEGAAHLRVRVPRTAQAAPGTGLVELEIVSYRDPRIRVRVPVELEILPYVDFEAVIEPRWRWGRRSGEFAVVLTNKGTARARVRLAAADPGHRLTVACAEAADVPPGGVTRVPLRASAWRRRWLRPPHVHEMNVTVRQGAVERTAAARLVQSSLVPRPLWRLCRRVILRLAQAEWEVARRAGAARPAGALSGASSTSVTVGVPAVFVVAAAAASVAIGFLIAGSTTGLILTTPGGMTTVGGAPFAAPSVQVPRAGPGAGGPGETATPGPGSAPSPGVPGGPSAPAALGAPGGGAAPVPAMGAMSPLISSVTSAQPGVVNGLSGSNAQLGTTFGASSGGAGGGPAAPTSGGATGPISGGPSGGGQSSGGLGGGAASGSGAPASPSGGQTGAGTSKGGTPTGTSASGGSGGSGGGGGAGATQPPPTSTRGGGTPGSGPVSTAPAPAPGGTSPGNTVPPPLLKVSVSAPPIVHLGVTVGGATSILSVTLGLL